VPLHRELDLLGEYVELMQIRFQGKLSVTMDIDPDARAALVPNLILQPIVENAIVHGVGQLAETTGRIAVRARRVGEHLVLTVADNGPGPGGGEPGVGLSNTSSRLRVMYGAAYPATLRAGSEGGTVAELTLPFHTTPLLADGAR
jgi:two-component system, LytTR family, sensor kinase